ncbi:ABC transporter ATP-binding protein [Priestia filamentosa]|nr:ABC transporter ATP-binding protein [Priestia filamentosa]
MGSFLAFVGSKLRSDKLSILLILLSLLIHACLTILTPWLTMKMIDYVLPENDRSIFWWIILGIVIVPALGGILMTYEDYHSNRLGHKVVTKLRVQFFKNYLQTKLNELNKRVTGQYIQKIVDDSEQIAHWIYITASRVILNLFQLIVMFAFLFHLNKQLAYISFGLLLLYFIPYIMFASKFLSASYNLMKKRAEVTGLLNEGIKGIYTVKAMGVGGYLIRKYQKGNEEHKESFLKFSKIQQLTEFLIGLVVAVGVGIVYLYGGYKVLNAELTIGVLVAAKMYIENVFDSARNLFIRTVETVEKIPIAKELKDSERDINNIEVNKGLPLNEIQRIDLKDLSFRYKERTILHNFSLSVPVGKNISIVGKSGCGKSTLLKLLLHLYDFEGSISINDKSIKDYKVEDLRKQLVLVPQSAELISDSVWNNITFGIDSIEKEYVEKILRELNIDSFVLKLPEQYDTHVGQYTNLALSGGQIQRIAIARALIQNPQVLLLDESTSALDKENIENINKVIRNYMKGKTVIQITHNQQIASQSDLVIYFKPSGEIVIDTHEQLLRTQNEYLNHFVLDYQEKEENVQWEKVR